MSNLGLTEIWDYEGNVEPVILAAAQAVSPSALGNCEKCGTLCKGGVCWLCGEPLTPMTQAKGVWATSSAVDYTYPYGGDPFSTRETHYLYWRHAKKSGRLLCWCLCGWGFKEPLDSMGKPKQEASQVYWQAMKHYEHRMFTDA